MELEQKKHFFNTMCKDSIFGNTVLHIVVLKMMLLLFKFQFQLNTYHFHGLETPNLYHLEQNGLNRLNFIVIYLIFICLFEAILFRLVCLFIIILFLQILKQSLLVEVCTTCLYTLPPFTTYLFKC